MNIAGHDELKSHLKALKDNADAYKKNLVTVPSFLMNISRSNGQTFVAEFITLYLYENELRSFHALNEMKEYRLDGTLKQIKHIFKDIKCNAVYTNEFEGVVSIDFSALADYVNEYQVDYFIEEIGIVAQNATMIFYYDKSKGKSIEVIKDRIIKKISNCIDITVLPYTLEEYAEIVLENLSDRGVDVECGREMKQLLCKIIDSNHVTTAKQAVALAERLVLSADYSSLIPKIDYETLAKYFGSGFKVA